jgi:predicted DNA-binding transcriptional regulator YafY
MFDPLELIRSEARAGRTVLLTAREADGSVETREIEPYSLRPGKAGERLFYYCLKRQGTRNTHVRAIVAAEPTGNGFVPRWPVEF